MTNLNLKLLRIFVVVISFQSMFSGALFAEEKPLYSQSFLMSATTSRAPIQGQLAIPAQSPTRDFLAGDPSHMRLQNVSPADKFAVFRYKVDAEEFCQDRSTSFDGLKLESGLKSAFCADLSESPSNPSLEFFLAKDREYQQKVQANSISESDLVSQLDAYRLNLSEPMLAKKDSLGSEYDSLSAVMVFLFGAVLMTPEKLGGWPQARKDRIEKGFQGAWSHNIKEGLVFDKDAAVVNYAMHPYAGAAYYMIARKQGMTPIAAFGFSVLMSVQWELLEAIGEPISIQDLIATPVIGSLMGELFYQIYCHIKSHPEFAESFLGKLVLAIVDPIGSLSKGADHLAKAVWGPRARGRLEMFMGDPFQSSNRSFGNSWRDLDGRRSEPHLKSSLIGGQLRFSF